MKFGDTATVKEKLQRRKGYGRHVWMPIKLIQQTEVMVLGKRVLNNGTAEYFEDHVEYLPDEYITAYMVIALGGRSNPFYVTSAMLEAK